MSENVTFRELPKSIADKANIENEKMNKQQRNKNMMEERSIVEDKINFYSGHYKDRLKKLAEKGIYYSTLHLIKEINEKPPFGCDELKELVNTMNENSDRNQLPMKLSYSRFDIGNKLGNNCVCKVYYDWKGSDTVIPMLGSGNIIFKSF